MNNRDRIIKALNNKQPDGVPILEAAIDPISIIRLVHLITGEPIKVTDNVVMIDDREELSDLYCYLIDKINLDATCVNISEDLRTINNKIVMDKFGSILHTSNHGVPYVIEGVIKKASDLNGFDIMSKLKDEDFIEIRNTINKFGKSKFHFMNISDPFKISWQLRGGIQNLLFDYIDNPNLVYKLARITTDYVLSAINIACNIGIDGINLSGDLAGESSLIMSPEHYRKYVKPYHFEIVDQVHNKSLKIIKHSDGNIWPILDDLLEVGFDGIHPIQPQSMDIVEVKKHLSGKACIVGNIDCRYLLPYGRKEEVEKSVKETIEKIAPGGGYIISSSNSIHPEVKPENYIAMVRAVYKYGFY